MSALLAGNRAAAISNDSRGLVQGSRKAQLLAKDSAASSASVRERDAPKAWERAAGGESESKWRCQQPPAAEGLGAQHDDSRGLVAEDFVKLCAESVYTEGEEGGERTTRTKMPPVKDAIHRREGEPQPRGEMDEVESLHEEIAHRSMT